MIQCVIRTTNMILIQSSLHNSTWSRKALVFKVFDLLARQVLESSNGCMDVKFE